MLPPLHGIQFYSNKSVSHEPNCTLPFNLELIESTSYRDLSTYKPIWELCDQGDRYLTKIALYCTTSEQILDIQCEGEGQFVLEDDRFFIAWKHGGTQAQHYLQTLGASLFLEKHQVPCIHANAIGKEKNAILLMAPSRTGKSTLSAKFTEHGYDLLTDDMVAMYKDEQSGFSVYPSWSKLRLWPDSKKALFGTEFAATKVHSRFAKEELPISGDDLHSKIATPITALYYLNRIESTKAKQQTVEIKALSASVATVLLLQNSMLGDAYRALGLEAARLKQIAKIVKYVPMFTVTYESGYPLLDGVVESIDNHCASLQNKF